MKPKDGDYINGAVWIDGEPMCLDLAPNLKRTSKDIVQDSVKDQIQYIKRLQIRVDKMKNWLIKQ